MALLLLIASGSALLTMVAWASTTDLGPGDGQYSDAVLSVRFFAAMTIISLIAALIVAKLNGGGK